MSDHLQRLRDLFTELLEIGVEFTDEQKVYIILSSLDVSWDFLVLTMETMPPADLTVHM